MGVDDTLNTGLRIDLGLRLSTCLEEQECFSQRENQRNKKKFPSCLTLGCSAGQTDHLSRGNASYYSDISSFSNTSVKKEREFGVGDEMIKSPRVSEEDEEGSPRKKLRLTKEQSAILEDNFKEHSSLNPKQKQVLADQLNLKPRQVEVWFQNRRARTKLKQTEVDCELLKKCCEKLTEENNRLLKEVQELKSMKMTAAPYFMKMPAATFTMCPPCERVAARGGDVGSPPSRALIFGKNADIIPTLLITHPQLARKL